MSTREKTGAAVKAIAFLACLAVISHCAYRVLSWKDSGGINGLYRDRTAQADVLFIGSSHSFCTINTAILWDEYGIAAEDISEGGQIFASTGYYLTEALKTRRPRVVLVELFGMTLNGGLSNGNLYRNTVNMKWSPVFLKNKAAAVNNVWLRATAAEPIT